MRLFWLRAISHQKTSWPARETAYEWKNIRTKTPTFQFLNDEEWKHQRQNFLLQFQWRIAHCIQMTFLERFSCCCFSISLFFVSGFFSCHNLINWPSGENFTTLNECFRQFCCNWCVSLGANWLEHGSFKFKALFQLPCKMWSSILHVMKPKTF